MKWIACPFLALVLFFGTLCVNTIAFALPQGSPESYVLKTRYECDTAGVLIRAKNRVLNPHREQTIRYAPMTGESSVITLGHHEAMLWPRGNSSNFSKTLTVMEKTPQGKYIIAQEIDLGDNQKTKTALNIDVKGPNPHEPIAVACKVEMEWIRR